MCLVRWIFNIIIIIFTQIYTSPLRKKKGIASFNEIKKKYKKWKITKDRKIMIKKKYKCSYCLKIFSKKKIYELNKSDLFSDDIPKRLFICSSCLVKENESFEREQNGY